MVVVTVVVGGRGKRVGLGEEEAGRVKSQEMAVGTACVVRAVKSGSQRRGRRTSHNSHNGEHGIASSGSTS